RLFLPAYRGSGLVLQCLARCHFVPRRCRARRTLSIEVGAAIKPCSQLTWAAVSKVQKVCSRPYSRGEWWSSSASREALSSEKAVRSVNHRAEMHMCDDEIAGNSAQLITAASGAQGWPCQVG